MKNILNTITELRVERGWSEATLSEQSGLPQSTISSWYRKNASPTVASLEKVCKAYGITLSQLFADANQPLILTDSQKQMLESWSRLTLEQQDAIFQLINCM